MLGRKHQGTFLRNTAGCLDPARKTRAKKIKVNAKRGQRRTPPTLKIMHPRMFELYTEPPPPLACTRMTSHGDVKRHGDRR